MSLTDEAEEELSQFFIDFVLKIKMEKCQPVFCINVTLM